MNDSTLSPTVLIIDDEPNARRRLINLLTDIKELFSHEIIGQAESFEDGFEKIKKLKPDLVFLDINMPDGSGLDLAAAINNETTEIIFLTARDDCALSAFNLDAVDYLLKPVKADRLNKACQKALVKLKDKNKYPDMKITDRGQVIFISIADIYYCRSELKYTTVKTKDKEYISNESLVQIEEHYPGIFLRTHRSTIVVKNKIKSLLRTSDADDAQWIISLHNLDDEIPVSRRQISIVRDILKSDSH